MLKLSNRWAPRLAAQAETGMGYQVATVVPRDGTRVERVWIEDGCISRVGGVDGIPFIEEQIADIVVTHDERQG